MHIPLFLLKPSPLGGVGVFTRKRLKEGDDLTHYFPVDDILIKKKFIKDKAVAKFYCVERKNDYWCPQDFHRMSLAWFINHADDPNVSTYRGEQFIVARDIKKGEELTIDYGKLDPDVNNKTFPRLQ